MITLAVTLLAGAVLNAGALIGGIFLQKYISGKDTDEELKRHELALEKYQSDYNEYQKKKQVFDDWNYKQENNKKKANENFKTTDEALRYYNRMHENDIVGEERNVSNYYKPNEDQKNAELIFLGLGSLGIRYLTSKMF